MEEYEKQQDEEKERHRKANEAAFLQHKRRNPNAYARRFAKFDHVRCFIGEPHGWVSGQISAVDHPSESAPNGSLPYIVMLDKPIKRQIAAPFDRNTCIRPEVCYADGPEGGDCAESVAQQARPKPRDSSSLRFAVGDKVACLTAGPDGHSWPRRWSAGVIICVWAKPMGAKNGTAVPYAIKLNNGPIVLASQDNHAYVRCQQLQPCVACEDQQVLERFAERTNTDGQLEKIDHQTVRVHTKKAPLSSDPEASAATTTTATTATTTTTATNAA